MKRLLTGSVALSVLALGGCIMIDADRVSSDFSSDHDWGGVYAANAGLDTVSITVHDNGCTNKDFYAVTVDKAGDMDFQVGFERVRTDHCKALNRAGRELRWNYSELGIPQGAAVTVLNPVRRY